jgi:MFS family permease
MTLVLDSTTDTHIPPRLYGRVIVLVALAYSIVNADLLIVSVALKSIGQGLHVPHEMLSWVISATSLPFAGFLILGGRAADIYGQRKCFLVGMSLFGVGSMLSAFAIDIRMLILTRGIEGIGSALSIPASISLINTLLPEGSVRHRALATLGSLGGAVIGLGSVIGGAIATTFGWRWCFFINLPLVALALVLAWQVIPRKRSASNTASLDVLGAILVCGAIGSIITALAAVESHGVASIQTLGYFGCGLAMTLAFAAHETRARDPMVPRALLKYRNVIGANLVVLCLLAALIGVFVIGGIFIQSVLGNTALCWRTCWPVASLTSHWTVGRFVA